MAELQTRQPIDTEALQKLIAKVKKGDAENAEAIATEKSQREDADAALQAEMAEINHRNLDVEFYSDELVFTKGRTVVNG